MQHFVISTPMLILGVVGIVCMIFFVFGLVVFGRLIKHQSKLWLLAKKGYTQIRHIKEDMTEKYYFLRIKDEHYTFDNGIYMEQKDIRTKTKTILAPFDYKILKEKPDSDCTPEELEAKKFCLGVQDFLKSVKDSKVMDITTLSWGIPTITYYANNPNPVNVKEIKKIYDAKNIAALIKRILMTKEWKLVRMVLILCCIALFLWVILGFLDYGLMNKAADNLGNCMNQLNVTYTKYTELLNSTRVYSVVANSTVQI